VAAPPIIRARLVELFTIGLALKDFRSAMFVSPPPPWGSTYCYGKEVAIHGSIDFARVKRNLGKNVAWRAKHNVCGVTH
jgi:hypothetical protein